jgi:hypothetical protein
LGSFLFHPKIYSIEKHVQFVKLPTRSQTRRVKFYSIESQNQVDFCCLICFSFVATVLEKQIEKEYNLRNRVLPPFVSDCTAAAKLTHHFCAEERYLFNDIEICADGEVRDRDVDRPDEHF